MSDETYIGSFLCVAMFLLGMVCGGIIEHGNTSFKTDKCNQIFKEE